MQAVSVLQSVCTLFLNLLPGFIEWAKEQIHSYAEMFRKQVYSSDADRQTIEEAIKITQSQSRRVRQDTTSLIVIR